MTVAPSWRAAAERVLGDRVAALGQDDGAAGRDRVVDLRVVHALGRRDVQAEPAQGDHVRLDGTGAEVATAGCTAAGSCPSGAAAGRGT